MKDFARDFDYISESLTVTEVDFEFRITDILYAPKVKNEVPCPNNFV